MKLEKFKERNHKQFGIIVFTIICILLVSGVILYRTFAIFEVKTNQNVIKGTIQDPGNIYFAFYVDNNIQKDMPQPNSGYILDEDASYCGTNGQSNEKIHVSLTEDYTVHVSGMTTSRTKCNLYFVKGAFILGKPVKAVTSSDGLYEVTHEDSSLDEGFKQIEWRYAGSNPHNYIKFNDEDWRIIGLVNVKIGSEIEQRVKIVREDSIGVMTWDTNGVNDWTQASLENYLNDSYYTQFKENAKEMIDENITWNLGGHNSSVLKASQFYKYERGAATFNNHPYEWKKESENIFHSIGLIYPSDYGYSTGGTSRSKCLDITLNSTGWGENQECITNTWLLKNSEGNYFTMMPQLDSSVTVFVIIQKYLTGGHGVGIDFEKEVLPVTYLKPTVQIINDEQDGSKEKPYNIS